jgi:hypothetical protein
VGDSRIDKRILVKVASASRCLDAAPDMVDIQAQQRNLTGWAIDEYSIAMGIRFAIEV